MTFCACCVMLKKSFCIEQPFKMAVRDPCRSETLTGARGILYRHFGGHPKKLSFLRNFRF